MGFIPNKESPHIPKSKSVYSTLTAEVGDEEDPIVYYPPIPGQDGLSINVPSSNFEAVAFGPLIFDLSDTTGQRVEVDMATDNGEVLSGLTRVMVSPVDQSQLDDLSLVNVRVYEREELEVSGKEAPTPSNVD